MINIIWVGLKRNSTNIYNEYIWIKWISKGGLISESFSHLHFFAKSLSWAYSLYVDSTQDFDLEHFGDGKKSEIKVVLAMTLYGDN